MYFSTHRTSTQHNKPTVLKNCLVDIVDMKQRQKCLELASSAGMCINLTVYIFILGSVFHQEQRRLNMFFLMFEHDCVTVKVKSDCMCFIILTMFIIWLVFVSDKTRALIC